jgi:hypothetical protein
MHITRKQALVALVAGVVPWISRRAHAELAERSPESPTRALPAAPTQAQFEALQKRVTELEKQLANQAAFVKDSAGNISLDTKGNVSIKGNKLLIESSSQAKVVAASDLTFKGSVIKLN